MSRPNCFGESFENVQKMKMTQSSCSFCLKLELAPPHACHKFTCSKCLPPIFMCVASGRDGHTTNMSCKCFSRLHQYIVVVVLCRVLLFSTRNLDSVAYINSSKHLLCPLILEPGPISSVYHPLLPLSHIIFVQHFANVLLWIEKKY